MKALILATAVAALAGCASQGNPAMTNAGLAILAASNPPPPQITTTNCRRIGAGITCTSY